MNCKICEQKTGEQVTVQLQHKETKEIKDHNLWICNDCLKMEGQTDYTFGILNNQFKLVPKQQEWCENCNEKHDNPLSYEDCECKCHTYKTTWKESTLPLQVAVVNEIWERLFEQDEQKFRELMWYQEGRDIHTLPQELYNEAKDMGWNGHNCSICETKWDTCKCLHNEMANVLVSDSLDTFDKVNTIHKTFGTECKTIEHL